MALAHQAPYLSLSARQEILLPLAATAQAALAAEGFKVAPFPAETGPYNLVTSQVAAGLYPAVPWLAADTYAEVLETLPAALGLPVNLTDAQQPLVPRFGGELNLLASLRPDYWHVFGQRPDGSGRQAVPGLVETRGLAPLLHWAEAHRANLPAALRAWPAQVPAPVLAHWLPQAEAAAVTPLPFPALEGFSTPAGPAWLGLFRRDYRFSLPFLAALAQLAAGQKIGRLYLTPWRTWVVKDLRAEHRPAWELLLGRHQFSTQHSPTELRWQLPDGDEVAHAQARAWASELHGREAQLGPLSFALASQPFPVATSVLIKPENGGYALAHTPRFERSGGPWVWAAHSLAPAQVPEALIHLAQTFFEQNQASQPSPAPAELPEAATSPGYPVLQCSHCLSVYDPQVGDPAAQVPPQTPPEALPDSYCCHLCAAPRSQMQLKLSSVAYGWG
ncbi:MAG: rubredoxin [Bernardetiaceae bacterium]|nr:rubredoxin [Bernardetiaceae bacterium]